MGHQATRIEQDAIGKRELPASVLYGINTLRAVENFPISGVAHSKVQCRHECNIYCGHEAPRSCSIKYPRPKTRARSQPRRACAKGRGEPRSFGQSRKCQVCGIIRSVRMHHQSVERRLRKVVRFEIVCSLTTTQFSPPLRSAPFQKADS